MQIIYHARVWVQASDKLVLIDRDIAKNKAMQSSMLTNNFAMHITAVPMKRQVLISKIIRGPLR